ncbi:hypothetical protein [Thauera sinica]|uniref:Uncharacterized protein n=1 Tax=Thauera sinica TaxID=2665146 RepID=A0ABW1AWP8_9RHOO|nr:hypothetical protein [Thauera sp. K11]
MIYTNYCRSFLTKTDETASIFWIAASYLIYIALEIIPNDLIKNLAEILRFLEFIPAVKSIEHGAVFNALMAKVHFCVLILFFPIILMSYMCIPKKMFFRKVTGRNRLILFSFVMPLISLIAFLAPVSSGSIGRFLSSFSIGFSFLSALIVICWSMTFRGFIEVVIFINSNEGD